MNELIMSVICFIATNVLVFLVLLIINNKKIKSNKNNISELNYLINKFKLNKNKMNLKKVVLMIDVINAFIIAFVATVIYIIPLKLFLQLSIGFVLLMILIYSIYEIYGRHLNKKWGKK